MTVAATADFAPNAVSAPRPLFALTFGRFLLLCGAQSLFAILLGNNSRLATLYVLAVLVVACATTWKCAERGMYWAAYLVGAELLWRMAGANVPWETGKYSAALLLLMSMRGRPLKSPFAIGAATYFLLLLPACALTLSALSPHFARTRILFNLSGPLLLAVAVAAIAVTPVSALRPQRLLAFMAIPIVGLAARVGKQTLSFEEIYFEAEASYATSGGYGPNQVATILGLGALLLVMLALANRVRWQQLVLMSMGGALFFEAMLTFSRGGVVAALCAIIALVVHMVASPKRALGYLVGLTAAVLVLWFLVLPRADNWTGGKLFERFTDLETTGRTQMMVDDLRIFRENPVFGVGPGLAIEYRPPDIRRRAPHTEFSRVVAEHGVLGLLSFSILLWMCAQRYFSQKGVGARAWSATFVTWGILNMGSASTRMAAATAIIGLAFFDFSGNDSADA